MRDKIYFISDAHLGSGNNSAERERQLCQMLSEIEPHAKALYVLGDLFDFWFTYRYVVPRGYVRILGKLAELADHGVEIHFFVGNHDMWMFDYLQEEMGVIMHNDPVMMQIEDKTFLIGHGDGLGHLDKHYDCLRSIFRNRINQQLFSLLPEWMTFGIALRWSRHSRLSHPTESQHYMGDNREGIVIYCKEQLLQHEIDYCVFAHRHTPMTKTITADNQRSALYVNTGDWLYHRSYAVFSAAEGLKLYEWQQYTDEK